MTRVLGFFFFKSLELAFALCSMINYPQFDHGIATTSKVILYSFWVFMQLYHTTRIHVTKLAFKICTLSIQQSKKNETILNNKCK